jgi:hypothetical protein
MAMSKVEMEHRWNEERMRRFRSIGYFGCRKILSVLSRFQDLHRHLSRWPPDQEHAAPLKLLIPEVEGKQRHQEDWLIEREINRLEPMVSDALDLAGVETRMVMTRKALSEDSLKLKEVKSQYDLVMDYLTSEDRLANLPYLMQTIERARGIYEHKKDRELKQLLNPITWIAALVRLPIIILEKAGLQGDEASSKVIHVGGQ